MAPDQALERIRQEIILSGRDTRYRIEAYAFVLNGLEFYLTKIGEKRHVSGQEFARGLVDFAVKQFGPLAHKVLAGWGIQSTNDLGYVVYNLIDINMMSKQEGDSLEDFFDVLDIKKYCEAQDPFVIDGQYIRSIRGA